MAHYLHIRPWEIELLTREQLESACAWIDRHIADQTSGVSDG